MDRNPRDALEQGQWPQGYRPPDEFRGLRNTARAVYGLYDSPDDKDGRDFLPMKYNMGKSPRGRSYVIRDLYSMSKTWWASCWPTRSNRRRG